MEEGEGRGVEDKEVRSGEQIGVRRGVEGGRGEWVGRMKE